MLVQNTMKIFFDIDSKIQYFSFDRDLIQALQNILC